MRASPPSPVHPEPLIVKIVHGVHGRARERVGRPLRYGCGSTYTEGVARASARRFYYAHTMTPSAPARNAPCFASDWVNPSSQTVNCRTAAEERRTIPRRLPDLRRKPRAPESIPGRSRGTRVRVSANHGRSLEPQLLNFNRSPVSLATTSREVGSSVLRPCCSVPPGAPDPPRACVLCLAALRRSCAPARRSTPANMCGEPEDRARGKIFAHTCARGRRPS